MSARPSTEARAALSPGDRVCNTLLRTSREVLEVLEIDGETALCVRVDQPDSRGTWYLTRYLQPAFAS